MRAVADGSEDRHWITDSLHAGVTTLTSKGGGIVLLKGTKVRGALARALSLGDVNQLDRDTGQVERQRTVTPQWLFLAIVSALASAQVESLADEPRTFNCQHGVHVAYKAFYNRLARARLAHDCSGCYERHYATLACETSLRGGLALA